MSLEYDNYLSEHISNVQKAVQWMADNLKFPEWTMEGRPADRDPETIWSECIEIAKNHDVSKYDKSEYEAYDAYFNGGNRTYEVMLAFNYAWLQHQKKNPHHWQYWVLINDDPNEGIVPLPMPIQYIVEMIADWWSFSWKNNNLTEIFNWYDTHSGTMLLHPYTRQTVEYFLNEIHKIIMMQKRLAHGGVEDDEFEEKRYRKESDEERDLYLNETEDILWHSDMKFGLPDLKKYPMPDMEHVRSAIKFFNYVDSEHEEELANAILARMDEYGMSFDDFGVGDENRFKKYIPKEAKEKDDG